VLGNLDYTTYGTVMRSIDPRSIDRLVYYVLYSVSMHMMHAVSLLTIRSACRMYVRI
jgi:hypothetical protein